MSLTPEEASEINALRSNPVLTLRPTVPEAEALLGVPLPCLDHGFVRLVDYMGDDGAVVQAARVSYGRGTKKQSDDRGLIRYLMRHRHCYHPSMEVLTATGWKRWDQCEYRETFLVPDPRSRSLSPEVLALEVFDADEDMQFFENNRMSYGVTTDHRMWFKDKYQSEFGIIRANEMPKWGHFDPMAGYRQIPASTPASPLGKLIGFALGDGSWSGSGLSFHLRKPRKKSYLRQCLSDLGLAAIETPSGTYADATVFYVSANIVRGTGMFTYLTMGQRSADKKLLLPQDVSAPILLGIFDGLVNSAGHINEDRNGRIEFSSNSPHLATTFEMLAAMVGMDAHRAGVNGDVHCVNAYPEGRTTLEARKKYFRTEHYTGKVYCATTSTGLLMVRGGPDKFGFVCGNTTPLEMCEIKLHVKLPIFVARQWVRHRTANINEISARYSILDNEFYVPDAAHLAVQSADNKQGRGGTLDAAQAAEVLELLRREGERSYAGYESLLGEHGLARELARMNLPVSWYTQWYWKIDLHNLLHFLSLRIDPHAQYEIRVYAEAIAQILRAWVPVCWEAFTDYRLGAVTLSRQMLDVVRRRLAGEEVHYENSAMSRREWEELSTLLRRDTEMLKALPDQESNEHRIAE